MKRALRDKWAAALEGGKFRQATGCLRTDTNGCCCLGVLADLYDPDLWIDPGPSEGETYSYDGSKGELTPSILQAVGLTQQQQNRFIDLNDSKGLSFEQIAQRVRELPVEEDEPKHRY